MMETLVYVVFFIPVSLSRYLVTCDVCGDRGETLQKIVLIYAMTQYCLLIPQQHIHRGTNFPTRILFRET